MEQIRLAYPEDFAPRQVRIGIALYVGRPGEELDALPQHVKTLVAHGWTVVEDDLAELQGTTAKDLVAGIKAGELDVERVRIAEETRDGGPRSSVMDAITEAAGTSTSQEA